MPVHLGLVATRMSAPLLIARPLRAVFGWLYRQGHDAPAPASAMPLEHDHRP
ncbi:hypothetical protein [Crossiella sp. CA198]|uniref:hypothetical protein n=1 Tax=Crossiella sp. CA198 TaxID=3455607 RepID=UPI003F8D4FC6